MPTRERTDVAVYQLKATLQDIKPPIWRRIQVTSDTNLFKLHRILQVVMGWEDSHLHQFVVGQARYSLPDSESGLDVRNEKKVKLSEVTPGVKKTFTYEYDFGDSWLHDILVEKLLEPEPGVRYPLCLQGERAGPPEDCGGVWGYESFVEAIRDSQHPDHEYLLEWAGGHFNPEAFDLESINRELKALR